jgi:hypothetical protein
MLFLFGHLRDAWRKRFQGGKKVRIHRHAKEKQLPPINQNKSSPPPSLQYFFFF